MVKKQCPGRLPWENTLCCLRERQGPSQKNIWQDWERVVGLIGQGHIWDVLNLGAQPDSSLLPVGRNRETLPPLSQPDGPEQWLLSRLAPWVESLGATFSILFFFFAFTYNFEITDITMCSVSKLSHFVPATASQGKSPVPP